MRIRTAGLTLLLIVAATSALADQGGFGRSPRDAVRAYHMQSAALDRDNSRMRQPGHLAPEQNRNREQGAPESSGYGSQIESQSNSSSDHSRRQGKLSPEERRALRRQIDEAGHDIYAPRR